MSAFTWFFLCLSPLVGSGDGGSGGDEEPSGGNVLRLIQIRVVPPSLEKTSPAVKHNRATSRNRRFKFQKRSQHLIGPHKKTLSITAMCVCNPDRSPVAI